MSSLIKSPVSSLTNWIDGKPAEPSDGQMFTHVPAREGSEIVQVPQSDVMDVVQSIAAMNRAQAAWGKETAIERSKRVTKALELFRSAILKNAEDLATMLAHDIGMPIRVARARSLPGSIGLVEAALAAQAELKFEAPSAGIIALLLGWTDPLTQFCRRVPLALVAGCPIVVKASSHAPLTLASVARLWIEATNEAAVPAGLFALLNGRGENGVGEVLLRHPAVKTVHWIGRSEAALRAQRVVNEASIDSFKRLFFYGSGRNPAVVAAGEGVDVKSLAATFARALTDTHALGPYRPSRFFIQDSIYKDFTDELKVALEALVVGDPLDPKTEVGPLPKREVARFDRQLAAALGETGKLVTGGVAGSENGLVRPTLVRDLTNCSTLQGEELAGPWATIASYKYQHEALKYANTSPLGLAGYAIHPDAAKAESLASKLEVSRVFFQAEPPWPAPLITRAMPVKQSANVVDGFAEFLALHRWQAVRIKNNAKRESFGLGPNC